MALTSRTHEVSAAPRQSLNFCNLFSNLASPNKEHIYLAVNPVQSAT
jgi:hypothetical protein